LKPILPRRVEPLVFGLTLSGLTSCIITALATFSALGLSGPAAWRWLSSWPIAWALSFPTVTLLAPAIKRLSMSMTGADATNGAS
jgi:hypothetical protein